MANFNYDWTITVLSIAGHTFRILVILLLARLACSAIQRFVPAMTKAWLGKGRPDLDAAELARRHDTVSSVIVRTVDVLVWVIAAFMILAELEINIAPVLAGVSIAGIAIGFGAQSLVRDVVAGLFVLLEDQYRKGDVIKVAGVSGVVEDVNLRRTVLRDLDGTVHNIPNGEIKIASNLTRDWSRVNLDVSVAYDANLDRVVEVINRVGDELAADPYYAALIIEPPKVLRLESFEESAMKLKILGVTRPMKQWEVAGELRRRIKQTFDANGIEMPFPHRVLVSKNLPSEVNGSPLPADRAQRP